MSTAVMDEDQVTVTSEDLAAYMRIVKRQLRAYVETVFEKKQFHCGGKIPLVQLMSDETIDLVCYLKFCRGIHLAHSLLAEQCQDKTKKWAIKEINGVIKTCRKHGIPHTYQAGMVLLHIKFCLGLRLPSYQDCLAYGAEIKDDDTPDIV
jgi:hypothetical protein